MLEPYCHIEAPRPCQIIEKETFSCHKDIEWSTVIDIKLSRLQLKDFETPTEICVKRSVGIVECRHRD